MRNYTESWDYTLTYSSLPYAINNGSPYFSGGLAILPVDSFLNKDYYGYYSFQGQNYDGYYGIEFTIDVSNAGEGSIFTVLCYGSGSYSPALYKTSSGLRLGWTSYTYGLQLTSPDGPDGDFNGTYINESGTYTVVYLSRPGSESSSQIAMHVVSPSGVRYSSGWKDIYDSTNHIQIGNNQYGSGYWAIGAINVSDQLTTEESENYRANGSTVPTCARPTFSQPAGSYDFSVDVEIACSTIGASIHYTIDGSDPTTSSPVYSSTIHLTSNTTIKALAVLTDYANSSVSTALYTVISNPICGAPVIEYGVESENHTVKIAIASSTASATIYYTTDGSQPTALSPMYTAPFVAPISTQIRAFAVKNLYTDSQVSSSTYIHPSRSTKYTHLWGSTVWSPSSYSIHTGHVDVINGEYIFGNSSGYITKVVDSQYAQYSGNYSIKFYIDTRTAAEHMMFSVLSLESLSSVPAIEKTPTGIRLGWAYDEGTQGWGQLADIYYTSLADSSGGGSSVDGDFDGRVINEDGLYSIVYIKKHVSNTTYVAMRVTSPAGLSYVSGWAPIYDPYGTSLIGSLRTIHNDIGTWKMGPITAIDGLLEEESDLRRSIAVCATPELSPAASISYQNEVSVSVSQINANTSVHYTLDGGVPNKNSPEYTSQILLLASRSLAAVTTSDSIGDSPIIVYQYSVTFGGPILREEPWLDNDGWIFSGEKTINGNNLVLDAEVNGVVSAILDSGDIKSPTSSLSRQYDITCIEFNITCTGIVRFGVARTTYEFVSNNRVVEFAYSDGSTTFFIRGSESTAINGFDGSISIPGNSFMVRVYYGNDTHGSRISIWDASGSSLIADTGVRSVNGPPSDNIPLTKSNVFNFNGSSSSSLTGYFWQSELRGANPGNPTITLTSMRGVTTIAPYKAYSNCEEDAAVQFVTIGTIDTVINPALPTANVIEHENGTNTLVITPDGRSSVIATIDNGYYVASSYDVITSHLTMVSNRGQPLTMFTAEPLTIRAVGYNSEISDVITQYVGAATNIPVPEISPRCGGVDISLPIRIYCSDADAVIRYTTDGSDPILSSTIYTGPIFVRSNTIIKAKSFKNGEVSELKRALFWEDGNQYYSFESYPESLIGSSVPCLPITGEEYLPSSWYTSNNATFDDSAKTITINDPTGKCVTLRSDVLPYYDKTYGASFGFRVNGNFRLRAPGTSAHICWVGDYVGYVQNIGDTPTNAMNGAVYATVVVEFAKGSLLGVVVRGFDISDVEVASYMFKQWQSTGISVETYLPWRALESISFAGDGLAPYVISNIQMMMLTSDKTSKGDYPWVFPGKPSIAAPTDMNYVGQTITVSASNPADTVRYTITSLAGETYGSRSPTLVDPSIVPMPTDAAGRIYIKAIEVSPSNLCQVGYARGNGSRVFSELSEWNMYGDVSDIYTKMLDTHLTFNSFVSYYEGPDDLPYPVLSSEYIHRYREYRFLFPYTTMDSGNAWFRLTPDFGELNFADSFVTCGWDTDRNNYEVVLVTDITNGYASTRINDAGQQMSPLAYINTINIQTWTQQNGITPKYISAHAKPTWHCGRRISSGTMYLRTMLIASDTINNVLYDTGWVSYGSVPAALPRPRVILRKRKTQTCYDTNAKVGRTFMRGNSGLTDTQLDNCFLYGTANPPPEPALTDSMGTPVDNYAIGEYPDTNWWSLIRWAAEDNPGSDAVYYKTGDDVAYSRSSNFTPTSVSFDECVITTNLSGNSFPVPYVSFFKALNLNDPVYMPDGSIKYDGRSPAKNLNLTKSTLDFVTINTSIPRHVYVQFDKRQLPDVPAMNNTPTFWKVVFSDGYEYPINALVSDDIERMLDPGIYTMKFVRYGIEGSYRPLGETLPATFTISDRLTLTTAAPASTIPNTAVTFNSSVAGGDSVAYTWSFSDGSTYNTQNVSRSFIKPGRYSWNVRVVDATGDTAQMSGKIVVVFPVTTVPTEQTVRTQETRVS